MKPMPINIKHCLFLLTIATVAACTPAEKPSDGDEPQVPEVTLPEPPDQVKDANVFIIDMFTTLDDDGDFFTSRDEGVAADYIRNQQGKMSLVYIYDRADYQPGKQYSMTKIAYNVGAFPYFAQTESVTDGSIKGTGMVTRYPIADFDGFADGTVFLSGCTVQLPITLTDKLCIATASIPDTDAAEKIFKAKKVRMLSDMMIVGTVPSGEVSQVGDYFKSMSMRVTAMGSVDTQKDIIVILPPSYVCRSIDCGKHVNLPYYRIYIEKWM